VLLSLASNLFIALEAKFYKAMPLREVSLIIYKNIILLVRSINAIRVKRARLA
jgi:hypothetical protein